MDGRQDEDERDHVYAGLGDVLHQVVFGQVTLEGTAALGAVERVLL